MTKLEAKQEAIKNAWNNVDGLNTERWATYWNYEKVKDRINENGSIYLPADSADESGCWLQPPQLYGIHKNNDWIIIESKNDLPKKDGLYFVFTKNKEIEISNFITEDKNSINEWTEFTHYQKVLMPFKPVY